MTTTVNETTLNVEVDVRFNPTGRPLGVRHDGRLWAVTEEPVHWFERDSWWERRTTAPVGVGNIVDIEFWRIQVKLSANSALRTFLLRLDPAATRWVLESIS
ncbi:hypothetical protein IG195_20110 (plasmid) [Arthrobacter sp. TES]|uniref:hypothetical protein n=1 Tax=Paenarthrobacter TaxID=1742992 RepID=UPI000396CAC6|nr:hypothetical protein [Paenarthrobacter sp. PAE-2]AOY73936.1 hypothetical protein ARZXY2_4437 [Arthrobacter sp. ZXY-2]MCW3768226.1 hypothetical protein [Paenarthrobacter sp. PAE-2]QOI65689.1 hypothetical protein IG195_20110 [Arthrobacter sp. TES]